MTSTLRHPVLQLAPKHPPPPVGMLSKPGAVLTSAGKGPPVGVPSKFCSTFANVITTAKRPLASSPLLKKKCVARAGAEGGHAARVGSPRSVTPVPTASAGALTGPTPPPHTARTLLSSSRLPRIASRAVPPSPATPRTLRGGGGGGGSASETEHHLRGKERRQDAAEQVKIRKNERNSLEKASKGKSAPQVVSAAKQAHKRKQSKESCDIPNKAGPASKGPASFKSHLGAPFPTPAREKPGRGIATKQDVACKFPAIVESPGQAEGERNLALKTSSEEDGAHFGDDARKVLGEVQEGAASPSVSANLTLQGTAVLRCRAMSDPDRSHGASRPVSPCRSDLSSASDQSHVSNLSRASRISTRRRLVALQNAKAGTSVVGIGNGTSAALSSSSRGGPPRRDSRVYCGGRSGISADNIRKKSEADCKTKLEKIKGPKSHKLPPSKVSDSTKVLKPGPRTSQQHDNGASRQHEEITIKQQLHEETTNRKQLHEQLVKQLQVASKAQKERDVAERNVEALTVLVHYLTQQYDAFSMPWVKSQVVSLTEQLASVHLSLDESYAANKRFQEEVISLKEQHELYIEQLKNQHKEQLEEINKKHETHLQEVENNHRSELEKFAKDQEEQLKTAALQQKEDLKQLEAKWQKSVEEEYERHVKALQQVQGQHAQELNDLKSEHLAKESHWHDVSITLNQEKESLKQQASKLEETLLNDADYRLQAVRKMCAGLQNEVDSMKMVVDMRNTEIHELRNQVGQMARLTEELEATREKAKALQAKNEDLKAQMEKKALYERQLMNERRQLAENYQKESNVNKRLSLENEELQWKLRQRDDAMSASFSSTGSTSTLDLLTRSPSVGRRHEGSLSPQVPPRSPRLSQRSGGDIPCSSRADIAKRRGQLGLVPNLDEENLHSTLESPPPSPCVKAVVEKSNSVSFILDLNESQSEYSFLDIPASPRPRPTRTASLGKADRAFREPCKTRKALLKSKSNASDHNGILGSLCGRFEIVKVDSRPQSSSESEHGSELENARQSPTGLAWTVPINQRSENSARTDMRSDENQVFSYSHQKEQSFYHNQIEDEYEEMKDGTHQFIEVVELRGRHCFKTDVLNLGSDGKLEMNKLNIMTSSSEGTSESEMSQCDIIKVGTSSESESDSSEDDRLEASLMDDVSLTSHGPLVGSKGSPWCPKEGAGEAMVTDELLSQYNSDTLTMDSVETVSTPPCNDDQSLSPHRRLSYGPSSDSEGDTAQLETNDAANVDISWSEDVECDITSSSEMHEV